MPPEAVNCRERPIYRAMQRGQIAGMDQASQLKIALYGLGIAIGAALAVSIITWGLNLWSAAELACSTRANEMEMVKSNGCLEFWFNRYQSLIGNVLTAAVAGATLLWIARQFNLAERQARAEEIAHLRDRSRRLEDERATIRKLRDFLFALKSYGQGIGRQGPNAGMNLDIVGGYRETITDIELITASIVTNSAVDPDSSLASLRTQLLELVEEAVFLARGNVFQLNRALTAGVTKEWLDRFEATRDKIQDRVNRADRIRSELNSGLSNEMKAVLADIGVRERDAFAFTR
jgi:hypothetical protein